MVKTFKGRLPNIIKVALVVGLWLSCLPASGFAQQNSSEPDLQNLIVNGGFEQGFQNDFGVGYGWGGFSNGSAVVGWNSETWNKAIGEGQYAQRIEIKNATDRDRYAGIYQTVHVAPGQQYKLTIKGLIRSEEGDIESSDYGYRLQYAIDYGGGTTWELLDSASWQEIPWSEQPLYEPPNDLYRLDSYETTVTAKGDRLTLFIRGWKKWVNNGRGVYNLDEISLVGPAPADFQDSAPQAVAAGSTTSSPEAAADDTSDQAAEQPALTGSIQPLAKIESVPQPALAPQEEDSPLPVSGRGRAESINYVLIAGVVLLVVLFGQALMAVRRRTPIN